MSDENSCDDPTFVGTITYSPNYGIKQQGWECPKCGRVYSPITPMCYYCQPSNVKTVPHTGQEY